MRLKTAYWTTAAMSTPALEHRFIDASIIHNFNDCAKVQIRLADGDGSMLQKYDSDAVGDAIYVGSGQALLYALDGTCRFNGRILAAERTGKILTLTCEDWMNQLKDERIHYDFREDIDGAGLRESTIQSDYDAATCVPVDTAGANYYIYDDAMSGTWGNDDWNGYYVVIPKYESGDITVSTGPSAFGQSNAAWDTSAPTTETKHLWVDDANKATWADNDGEFNFIYVTFQLNVTEGSLYNSIDEMRIQFTASLQDSTVDAPFGILDNDDMTKYPFGTLTNLAAAEDIRRYSITVPSSQIATCLETDGTVIFYFLITSDDPTVTNFKLYYYLLEVDVNVDAYTSAITITDTVGSPARLTTTTDVDVTGLGFWNGYPYSICREIYYRINAIITAGDPLVTLTSSVESTAGISTYHASDKTRFEILKFVAPLDKAVFWIPLGTKEVNWKITTDAAATTLTDPEVLRWYKTRYDIGPMKNQAIVYGARVGDVEVTQTVDAATSQLDYDVIRTEVVRNAGIMSDYEATAYGTTLTAQLAKVPLQLSAELAGFSSIRLGDWIEVTSNLLGITAGNYTVDRWEYSNDTTKIRLQPRGTDGYIQFREFKEEFQDQRSKITDTQMAQYLAPPTKQTW